MLRRWICRMLYSLGFYISAYNVHPDTYRHLLLQELIRRG